LRTSGDDYPFDVMSERYLSYDRDNPAASLDGLIEALYATINSTKQDSPVFRSLPDLREHDCSMFLTVPSDFRDEVRLARERRLPGDLDFLAMEVRGFQWEEEGLRLVGRAQFALRAHRSGRITWEAVRTFHEHDKEANTLLGTIYQRLGDLPQSDLALQRVLDYAETNRGERAEARSLLGRNAKTRWLTDWAELPPEQRAPRALCSALLEQSFTHYERAFNEDLNHFYSGLNAVAMLTILTELAAALPEVWDERADTHEEAESLLRERKTQLAKLAAAVELSIRAAKARLERSGEKDLWVGISDADLFCLTSKRPPRVAHKYQVALIEASAFDEDAVRRQLEMYQTLGILRENVEAALAVIKSELPQQEQRQIILFTGHRIDAPNRQTPRFPADKELVAREAIRQAVAQELARANRKTLGVAGGASGGDILFHEVCSELGIPTTLYLTLEREKYIEKSVQNAGHDWVLRFNELYGRLPGRELAASEALPRWLSSRHKEYSVWQRSNLWMLCNAIAADADSGRHVTLIALWDGQTGDGPGGTKDMVERAQQRGARIVLLDTKTLFGLGA
jgi:hypothetical protein